MADEQPRIPKITSMPKAEALRGLPLTPVDGFLLSRIDGTLNEVDLAQATGLATADVTASLEKLVSLGLVTMPGSSPVPAPRAASSPTRDAFPGTVPTLPSGEPPSDGIDLDPAQRRRIDDLHASLDRLSHYELLGVAPTVDKKAIKRAYYELASVYHPDRFFRKNLGGYKAKMETLFGRITVAQEVLTSKADRADYDEYLADVARTREMEARMDAGASALQEAQEVATIFSAPPPPPASGPRPAASVAPAASSQPPSSVSRPPSTPGLDAQSRRDSLARRLLGGRASIAPPAAPSAPPPPAPVSPPGDALRRHYEARLAGSRTAQARPHLEAARASAAKNDSIAAVNSLKLALEFSPDDPEIAGELDVATKAAEILLSETYLRQATYEEKNAQWPEASRSWTKLANIKTGDPTTQQRAANALVKANGNLHDAARFAQRAVALQPGEATYRATLGEVYLAAGLLKNARRELEAAQQLSPQDARIATLLKRAGKG